MELDPHASTPVAPRSAEDVRVCTVEGCEQLIRCKGLCALHYQRWWRLGDPLAYHRQIGPTHGIESTYNHYGCRCSSCAEARRDHMKRMRANRLGKEPPVHGASGYRNYGCRCDVCRSGNTERSRQRRLRRQIDGPASPKRVSEKRGGYTGGPKEVADLKPPPPVPGAGVRITHNDGGLSDGDVSAS